MLGPMGVLVACCFLIGLAPLLVAPILQQGISAWAPGIDQTGPRLVALAPLGWITAMGLLLVALAIAGGRGACGLRSAAPSSTRMPHGAAATWHRRRRCSTPRRRSHRCWSDCSAGCFVRGRIGPETCRCSRGRPSSTAKCPTRCSTRSCCRRSASTAWLFSWFRVLQQGNIQIYLLYIFLALIVLLLWR